MVVFLFPFFLIRFFSNLGFFFQFIFLCIFFFLLIYFADDIFSFLGLTLFSTSDGAKWMDDGKVHPIGFPD